MSLITQSDMVSKCDMDWTYHMPTVIQSIPV